MVVILTQLVSLVLLRFTNGSQTHWMVYMCGYDVTCSFCAITDNIWSLSQLADSVNIEQLMMMVVLTSPACI